MSHLRQRDCQGDVGCLVHVISRIFRIAEDVLGAEDEIHANAKGGAH